MNGRKVRKVRCTLCGRVSPSWRMIFYRLAACWICVAHTKDWSTVEGRG